MSWTTIEEICTSDQYAPWAQQLLRGYMQQLGDGIQLLRGDMDQHKIICNPAEVNRECQERARLRAEAKQQEGRKYDAGKPQLNLILPGFLWEMGEVLTHGATKYGAYNWQKVEKERYVAAKLRHDLAFASGESYDPETGLHHMVLSTCSAMFLWHLDGAGVDAMSRRCKCSTCNK